MPAQKQRSSVAEKYEDPTEERGESPEDEIREGAEDTSNRKRSARNAKRTKAPMDSECGCGGGGKKKCTCDGGCGYQKMDALTASEYLTACDLGIQHRSLPYIRARLDVKCGASGIPEGEKCTKGAGGISTGKALALGGAALGAGLVVAGHHRVMGNVKATKSALTGIKKVRNKSNDWLHAAKAAKAHGINNAETGYVPAGMTRIGLIHHAAQQGERQVAEARQRRGATYTHLRTALHDLHGTVPRSPARRRRAQHEAQQRYTQQRASIKNSVSNIAGMSSAIRGSLFQKSQRANLERSFKQPGRRDSIWAVGFEA